MGENTEDLDILFRQAALKAQARAEKAEKALAKGRFSNLYRTRDKFSYSQFCAQRAQVRAKAKEKTKDKGKGKGEARQEEEGLELLEVPVDPAGHEGEQGADEAAPPVPTAKNAKKKEKKEEDQCDSLVGHANHEKL